jgi:hypothetical protein
MDDPGDALLQLERRIAKANRMYFWHENYKVAEAAYKGVLKMLHVLPDDDILPWDKQEKNLHILTQLVECALHRNADQRVINYSSTALESEADGTNALDLLRKRGFAFKRQEKYEDALADLRLVVQEDPDDEELVATIEEITTKLEPEDDPHSTAEPSTEMPTDSESNREGRGSAIDTGSSTAASSQTPSLKLSSLRGSKFKAVVKKTKSDKCNDS